MHEPPRDDRESVLAGAVLAVPAHGPFSLTGYEPEFAPFETAEGRAQTMEHVERAIEEGEYLDLFFQRITPEQVPAFRELMRMVARYRGNVRTMTAAF